MFVIEQTINRPQQQNNNQLSAIAKAKGNICKPSIHNNSAYELLPLRDNCSDNHVDGNVGGAV